MADTIDSMIEGWARGRTQSVRASLDAPLQGLQGFTLTPEVPPLDAPATPLDAAQAVREAVLTRTTGKRPSVNRWRATAAKVLGFKRLSAKRWQEVLDAGIDAGLFVTDSDTLSYPILVAPALEPVAPAPEPVAPAPEPVAPAPDLVDSEPDPTRSDPVPDPTPMGVWPLPGYIAPAIFRCGHSNHNGHGITEDDPKQVAARAEGCCCEAQRAATVTYRRLNRMGSNNKASLHVHWRVRGLYDPIPVAMRRSPERDRNPGWPGLCCDPETGLYIGGTGNDCRRQGSGRCSVHAPRKRERPS